jgi:hypothetical protein
VMRDAGCGMRCRDGGVGWQGTCDGGVGFYIGREREMECAMGIWCSVDGLCLGLCTSVWRSV